MGKKREQELLIMQYQQENEQMKGKIAALEADVKRLQERESTIVNVMTSASSTAERIIADAESSAGEIKERTSRECARMVDEANVEVSRSKNSAQQIIEDAERTAAMLQSKANDYARERKSEADAYYEQRKREADYSYENAQQVANEKVRQMLSSMQDEFAYFEQTASGIVATLRNASKEAANQARRYSDISRQLSKKLDTRVAGVLDPAGKKLDALEQECTREAFVEDLPTLAPTLKTQAATEMPESPADRERRFDGMSDPGDYVSRSNIINNASVEDLPSDTTELRVDTKDYSTRPTAQSYEAHIVEQSFSRRDEVPAAREVAQREAAQNYGMQRSEQEIAPRNEAPAAAMPVQEPIAPAREEESEAPSTTIDFSNDLDSLFDEAIKG